MIERPDSPHAARLHASPNIEPRCGGARPSMLILHYTGCATCEVAIDWLSRPESKVSCHYVIDEAGWVTQMVAEGMRAWHAGQSFWAGETDINSLSIGVEIQNPGHGAGYPDFPEAQMRAVEALSLDIVARNSIRPERVLAHSDIAPHRKADPGEKFDWERLARAGTGHWVAPAPVDSCDLGLGLRDEGLMVAQAQVWLRDYGYGAEPSGLMDEQTAFVLTAFQRHFRPARVDGRLDASTLATLERLIAALRTGGDPL